MAKGTTNATTAVTQVFSSPQSSPVHPSLAHMPPEIKRAIVVALLELEPSTTTDLSAEAEALNFISWEAQWGRPRFRVETDSYRRARGWCGRLKGLAQVDRAFEQITAEWMWQYCRIPLTRHAFAFASCVHSISIYTHNFSPADYTFYAALIPTLPQLEEVHMEIPDPVRGETDMRVVDALASVAGRIRRLYLSSSTNYTDEDEEERPQDSAWLARYLRAFEHLTLLEIDDFQGGHTAQRALRGTIAALPELVTLRLRGGDLIDGELEASIPSTAPIRFLNLKDKQDASSGPNLRSLAPWLSAFGSSLETLVFEENDDHNTFGSRRLPTHPPSPFHLPRLTTLSLSASDVPLVLNLFSDAPLEIVALDVSSPTVTTQMVTDFIAAHPTLKRMWCYGARMREGSLFNITAIKRFGEARGIAFRRDR